jgi:alanine racemase
MMQTFVNKEDNTKALANVFPANAYGYGAILETDDLFNKEIEGLLK